MAKNGRPRKQIDENEFVKLCGMQCTLNEIAGFFDCSEDTIERWCKRELEMGFADAYKKYSAGGKISLRRTQLKKKKKSPAMAIFLGKNYLGQRDCFETEDKAALDRLDSILNGLENNSVRKTE